MRFSLKTMLTAISVAAVLCCIFFTLPSVVAIAVLGLMWLLAPTAMVAGIVYGRGYGRAFSIGCISVGGCLPIVWIYSIYTLFGALIDLSELDGTSAIYVKLGFGVTFLVVGMSGLTSMAVRWLSRRMAPQRLATVPAHTDFPANYAVLQRRVTTLPANPNAADPDDESEPKDKEL